MTEPSSDFRWRSGRHGAEDRVHRAYPDWRRWPRRLRQILVMAPALGEGEDGLREMSAAQGWDADEVVATVDGNGSFKKALEEYWVAGKYRHAKTVRGGLTRRPTTWDEMKITLASETSVVTFVRAEDRQKLSKAEMALLKASGMLDVLPMESQRTTGDHPDSNADDVEQFAPESTVSVWPTFEMLNDKRED